MKEATNGILVPQRKNLALLVTGLLVLSGLDRFVYYGMRSVLVIYLTDGSGSGGLGLEYGATLEIYNQLRLMSTFSPLVFGVVALVIGFRRAFAVAAAMFPIGCGWLAVGGASTVEEALVVLAVAQGGIAVSIYVIAGRLVENMQLRWALFCGLLAFVNLGALLGPFAGSLLYDFGYRFVFMSMSVVAVAASVVAVGLMMASRQVAVGWARPSARQVLSLVLFSAAAAWFWWTFSTAAEWTHNLEPQGWAQMFAIWSSIGMCVVVAMWYLVVGTQTLKLSEPGAVIVALVLLTVGIWAIPFSLRGPALVREVALLGHTTVLAAAEVFLVSALAAVSSLAKSNLSPAFVGLYLCVIALASAMSIEFDSVVLAGLTAATLMVGAVFGLSFQVMGRANMQA